MGVEWVACGGAKEVCRRGGIGCVAFTQGRTHRSGWRRRRPSTFRPASFHPDSGAGARSSPASAQSPPRSLEHLPPAAAPTGTGRRALGAGHRSAGPREPGAERQNNPLRPLRVRTAYGHPPAQQRLGARGSLPGRTDSPAERRLRLSGAGQTPRPPGAPARSPPAPFMLSLSPSPSPAAGKRDRAWAAAGGSCQPGGRAEEKASAGEGGRTAFPGEGAAVVAASLAALPGGICRDGAGGRRARFRAADLLASGGSGGRGSSPSRSSPVPHTHARSAAAGRARRPLCLAAAPSRGGSAPPAERRPAAAAGCAYVSAGGGGGGAPAELGRQPPPLAAGRPRCVSMAGGGGLRGAAAGETSALPAAEGVPEAAGSCTVPAPRWRGELCRVWVGGAR